MKFLKGRIRYAIECIIMPIINAYNRMHLKNKDFSIICGTCAGGVITHWLGKKFLSPTVNLWFTEKDLQKMVRNLKWYMQQELEFIDPEFGYPAAKCGDIVIHFNHVKTNEEAKNQWYKRRDRINYDNIWVISSDNKLSYEDIKEFGTIPCKGKVMFTAKEYPEFDYCLYIREYEGRETCGTYMSDHTPVLDRFVFEKYFDYVKWLNTGRIN